MPRGGRRNGAPGKAYSNRSDLQGPPKANFTGQAYGQAKAQADSQAAVLVAAPPQAPPVEQVAGPAPGSLGFTDPTGLPDQPLTHGLTGGNGPGPEVLPSGMQDMSLAQAKAVYRLYPTEGMRQLLEWWEAEADA